MTPKLQEKFKSKNPLVLLYKTLLGTFPPSLENKFEEKKNVKKILLCDSGWTKQGFL